jgi:hypothetical protein
MCRSRRVGSTRIHTQPQVPDQTKEQAVEASGTQPRSATSPTGLGPERRAESSSARRWLVASLVVVVDQQARGLAHPFGGPAADVAEVGGAQHRGGELNVAGETLDRERARGEDASEPLDLFDAVHGTGAGILQGPSKQIAAVVVTPGLSGD